MSALGYDPVPGDVDAVRRVATMLGAVADQADTITTRLRGIDDGTGPQVWRGPAADAFRRLLGDIGPDVTRLAGAHREAEDALRTYATDLDGAQYMARRAESDAGAGIGAREQAERERTRAAQEAAAYSRQVGECRLRLTQAGAARLTALTDPVYQAEMTRYEGQVRGVQHQAEARAAEARRREDTARSAESAAEARVQAARLLAEQAKQVRDDSARRVVNRLDAEGRAGLADGNPITRFLNAADDVARTIVTSPEFDAFLKIVSTAGDVLTLAGIVIALLPIPGAVVVGGALLGIGRVLGIVSFVGTAAGHRYGTRTLGDLAWEAAGLVPAGRVAKVVTKVVTRTLPGVSRTLGVMRRHVVDFATRPPLLRQAFRFVDEHTRRSPIRNFNLDQGYDVLMSGRGMITDGPRTVKTLGPLTAPFPGPVCAPAPTPRRQEVRL